MVHSFARGLRRTPYEVQRPSDVPAIFPGAMTRIRAEVDVLEERGDAIRSDIHGHIAATLMIRETALLLPVHRRNSYSIRKRSSKWRSMRSFIRLLAFLLAMMSRMLATGNMPSVTARRFASA